MSSKIISGDTAFFLNLRPLLKKASATAHDEIMKHVAYLADKANVTTDDIFEGKIFTVLEQVHLDAIKNIYFELEKDQSNLGDAIAICNHMQEGWCTLKKSQCLSELIITNDCKKILEIGIFGGKSLIPMALTLRHLGRGQVIGVEPWDNDEAIRVPTYDANDQWWSEVDFSRIKKNYFEGILHFDLSGYVRTLEITSLQAFEVLRGTMFDLIHIDGSHAEDIAYADVVRWHENLVPNGILVLDDCLSWSTVAKARQWVLEHYDLIKEEEEEKDVSYGVYRKHSSLA